VQRAVLPVQRLSQIVRSAGSHDRNRYEAHADHPQCKQDACTCTGDRPQRLNRLRGCFYVVRAGGMKHGTRREHDGST